MDRNGICTVTMVEYAPDIIQKPMSGGTRKKQRCARRREKAAAGKMDRRKSLIPLITYTGPWPATAIMLGMCKEWHTGTRRRNN
jgi:hypothetical protein